jgi:UDP-glucuronate decarboxylase
MQTEAAVTGPVNLGNPDEITIIELAEKIIELTNSDSVIVNRPLPDDDPVQRCPDITLAKNQLDWEPGVPLEKGLARTIDYFEKIVG